MSALDAPALEAAGGTDAADEASAAGDAAAAGAAEAAFPDRPGPQAVTSARPKVSAVAARIFRAPIGRSSLVGGATASGVPPGRGPAQATVRFAPERAPSLCRRWMDLFLLLCWRQEITRLRRRLSLWRRRLRLPHLAIASLLTFGHLELPCTLPRWRRPRPVTLVAQPLHATRARGDPRAATTTGDGLARTRNAQPAIMILLSARSRP